MKLLFTAFIDSLKPESVKYMPFLNSLGYKRRIRTELGYSITCKASIFSGVHPNKHHAWFIGKYSPDTSPFKWVKKFRVYKLPHNKYTRAACYMMTKILTRNKRMDYWGLFREPMENWFYFDSVEVKQPMFNILEANGVRCEVIDATDTLSQNIPGVASGEEKLWIHLFIGDVDPLTHRYGQDSAIVTHRLREIDDELAQGYRLLEREFGNVHFMCFSDHGQSKVEGKINLYSHFINCGKSLDDYIHFIESNYARFWFRNEKERKEVVDVLSSLGDKGFILTKQHLKKYHVDMPDNRYGDLIYYLNYPLIFDLEGLTLMGKELSGYSNFMHGFLPDLPEADGVFIANKEVVAGSHVELVDIFPSVLSFFDIEVPEYVDGRILWKETR